MNIRIDTEARAVYMEFKHEKVARTVEFAPETFIDLDTRGRLLGIELLNPGTLEVQLRKIRNRFHIPDNKHLRSELQKARELISG
jgi:uncharacterized protein YuzE